MRCPNPTIPRHLFASVLALALLAPACGDGGGKPKPETAQKSETKSEGQTDAAAAGKDTEGASDQPDWMPPAPIGSVAGEEIDYDEFVALYAARKKKAKSKKVGKSVERRSQIAIIDRLILERQLELESKATGVDYDPEDLEKAEVEQHLAEGDRTEFLEWMGETPESYRKRTIADLRERAIIRATADLSVTDEDLQEAYDKVKEHLKSDEERIRASHIFIAIGPREGKEKIRRVRADRWKEATPEQMAKWEADALAIANEVHAKVSNKGVDFAEAAKELSEGPGAYRGGDMGVFDRKRMIAEYSEKAFSMKVGEISEPVKAHDAYYIIRLDARHPPGTLSLDDIRPDLVRDVENAKFIEARKALRASLNEKYPAENVIRNKTDG